MDGSKIKRLFLVLHSTFNFNRWTAANERILNGLEYIYIKVHKVLKYEPTSEK